MGDARFSGIYMVFPPLGIVMLFVFILQFLIRLWMVNAPSYVRKHVRFPLNEDLTDYIMSKMEKPVLQSNQSIPHGYPVRPPHYRQQQGYQGYSNQGYSNQGYSNQGYSNQAYQQQMGYQNRGYRSNNR